MLTSKRMISECDRVFEELVKCIENAFDKEEVKQSTILRGEPDAQNILNKIDFSLTYELLDFQNKDIIRLLPFLMTAYTYNYRRDRALHYAEKELQGGGSFYELYPPTIKITVKGTAASRVFCRLKAEAVEWERNGLTYCSLGWHAR